MQGLYPLIGLLAWFQAKHFVADYLLQPAWILHGKGDLHHPGGYVHAAIHAVGSAPGLVLFGMDGAALATLVLGEFGTHYMIDHLKASHAQSRPAAPNSRAFWAAHGADQLLHAFTYTGMLWLVA